MAFNRNGAVAQSSVKLVSSTPHIIELLGDISERTGATKQLTPKELTGMAEFIQRNFGWMKVKHIDIAFEMWEAGRIAEDVNNFGAFTPQFVGKILSAYRQYGIGSGKMSTEYDRARQWQGQQIEREYHDSTPVDWGEYMEDLRAKFPEPNPVLVPADCYGWMVRNNKLDQMDFVRFEPQARSIVGASSMRNNGILAIGQAINSGDSVSLAKKLAVLSCYYD